MSRSPGNRHRINVNEWVHNVWSLKTQSSVFAHVHLFIHAESDASHSGTHTIHVTICTLIHPKLSPSNAGHVRIARLPTELRLRAPAFLCRCRYNVSGPDAPAGLSISFTKSVVVVVVQFRNGILDIILSSVCVRSIAVAANEMILPVAEHTFQHSTQSAPTPTPPPQNPNYIFHAFNLNNLEINFNCMGPDLMTLPTIMFDEIGNGFGARNAWVYLCQRKYTKVVCSETPDLVRKLFNISFFFFSSRNFPMTSLQSRDVWVEKCGEHCIMRDYCLLIGLMMALNRAHFFFSAILKWSDTLSSGCVMGSVSLVVSEPILIGRTTYIQWPSFHFDWLNARVASVISNENNEPLQCNEPIYMDTFITAIYCELRMIWASHCIQANS